MVKLFVLIKKKGVKKWTGAIPARSGVTRKVLSAKVRKFLRSGIAAKIITKDQLVKLVKLKNIVKKRKRVVKRKRRVVRKKTKRRK